MLNRAAGWLIFSQISYLASFVVFAGADAVSGHALFNAVARLRNALGIGNTVVRLTDSIYYPMIFSAPLNLALMIAFCWCILRRGHVPSLSTDFFSILNTVYIAGSGWVLFMGMMGTFR